MARSVHIVCQEGPGRDPSEDVAAGVERAWGPIGRNREAKRACALFVANVLMAMDEPRVPITKNPQEIIERELVEAICAQVCASRLARECLQHAFWRAMLEIQLH